MASYLGDFELLKLQQFGSIFTLRASCLRWKRRCRRDAEALRDVAAVMHFIGEIQPAPAWGADGDNHDLTFFVGGGGSQAYFWQCKHFRVHID